MKTYYDILGVNENASSKEIKNAHKTLMKKYHPDVYQGNEKIAAEINNAYDILSNSQSRAEYDQELENIRKFSSINNSTSRNYTQVNYKSSDNNNYNSYRRESAQNIYDRIRKNKNYKKEDYSNSYSYQTIKRTQDFVEKKLVSLTYFQLLLVVLVVLAICIITLALSILDFNNISRLKKSNNSNNTSTNTYYYPPYNKQEDQSTQMNNSLYNIMTQYGFDLYFDSVQEFYIFIFNTDNQDLYIKMINNQITADQYFNELLLRAEEKYK